MGKSKKVTVGYKYYMGLQLVLGYRVDRVRGFIVDSRGAWSGSASSGTITVDAPELFGGESREGGVSGKVHILDGNSSQAKHPYLVSQLGSVIPAYRGVFSLLLEHFYIGNNPYIKSMTWEVQRTDTLTDGTTQWNLSKADINDGDLNAAHIIRECLTSSDWGMDYPTTIIDDTAFTAAASTLYDEGFGLTMLWNQPETIEQFVQRVLDHINGVLREDPTTGDIGLALIREDYTPANLPLFDESNVISLESFERRAWGETINEITVTYHDRDSDKDVPVTVQDIGNIQIQGSIINQSRSYAGISNSSLAMRVAMRDLRAASAPLSKIEIKVNREGWALRQADVFRFTWVEQGLAEVVYRILSVSDGNITDGKITIIAVEDVWGLPTNTYTSPQTNGWVVPNNQPAAAPYERVMEASYWEVQRGVSQADIAQLGPDFGFVLAQAVQPSGDAYHYKMWARNGAADYEEKATGPFCPTAELDGALGYADDGLTDAVISIKNQIEVDEVEENTFAYVDDEIFAIKSTDVDALTITVDRGVLDSVPATHLDGARIWFAEDSQAFDTTERVDAEDVDVKLLPATGLGTLPIGSAATLNLILDNRYQRPYPPGNVQMNGEAYPAILTGLLTVSWSHRDRTLQTAYLNDQTETDIGPEAGTTYNLRIYDEIDTLVVDETGLAATNYTFQEVSTALANYITGTVGGGHLYTINEASSATAIEDIVSDWDRTLYGPTTELGAKSLLRESFGSAYLPGSGDYIGQSDKDLTGADRVTIFAVVEFSDLTGTHCIFQDGGGTRGLYFGTHGGDFGVWVNDYTGGNKQLVVTAATYLTVDTAHVVACLVDGPTGAISIQIDGTEVAQSSALGAFTDFNGSNGMSFGGCYTKLVVDGTLAPIGGLEGYLDYLFIKSSLVSQVDLDEMFTLAVLRDLDYLTEVDADSPHTHYRFDETGTGVVTDRKGNINGNYQGTNQYEETGLVNGDTNTCVLFGADGYVEADNIADYMAGVAAWTVSVIFKIPDLSSDSVAVFGCNTSGGSNRFVIFFDNSSKKFQVWDGGTNPYSTATYSVGDRLHIFFRYDTVSDDWALRVNKTEILTRTQAISVSASDTFSIGMEYDSAVAGDFIQEKMDEFVLFGTELSDERIDIQTDAAWPDSTPLNTSLRVELESVRDTLISRQMHDITVSRV